MSIGQKHPSFVSHIIRNPNGTEITTARLEVNGVNLHYHRTGWGAHAVLLIPGAFGSIETDFHYQITYLNKDIFTIIGFDPRGYGRSIPPSRDYPPGYYERDAKDAVDLMQALNFKKFSVIGFCDGGVVAMFVAGTYPSLIHKLVLVGSHSYIIKEELDLQEKFYQKFQLFFDMDREEKTLEGHSNFKQYVKDIKILFGEEYFMTRYRVFIDTLKLFFSRSDGNICRHMLPLIECPTLIIHGLKDKAVPLFHPQFIHQQIKDSRLHLVPEGKHEANLQSVEEINKILEEFMF